MFRGTTPTFTFKLPIDTSTLTKLSVVFKQPNGLVIEKKLSEITKGENEITVYLTEAETLSLKAAMTVEIQLRVGVGDARLASQIFSVPVEQILKDGAL